MIICPRYILFDTPPPPAPPAPPSPIPTIRHERVCRTHIENLRKKKSEILLEMNSYEFSFFKQKTCFLIKRSLYAKSHTVFFSAELLYSNNNKLCAKIKTSSLVSCSHTLANQANLNIIGLRFPVNLVPSRCTPVTTLLLCQYFHIIITVATQAKMS